MACSAVSCSITPATVTASRSALVSVPVAAVDGTTATAASSAEADPAASRVLLYLMHVSPRPVPPHGTPRPRARAWGHRRGGACPCTERAVELGRRGDVLGGEQRQAEGGEQPVAGEVAGGAVPRDPGGRTAG